jgi:hypothetical protein
MFSFMASQAIALSQTKQNVSKPRATKRPRRLARKRLFSERLFSRVFDALVEARMRRAEIEIEHHRRFYGGYSK